MLMGATDSAVADYTSVLGIRPRDLDAYIGRSNALSAMGDWTGAMVNQGASQEIEWGLDYLCIWQGQIARIASTDDSRQKDNDATTPHRRADKGQSLLLASRDALGGAYSHSLKILAKIPEGSQDASIYRLRGCIFALTRLLRGKRGPGLLNPN